MPTDDLRGLTPEQLEERAGALRSRIAESVDSASIEELEEMASQLDAIDAERERRAAEATRRAELRDRVTATTDEADEAAEDEGVEDSSETEVTAAEEEAEAEPEPARVAASARPVRRRTGPRRSATPEPDMPAHRLVATGAGVVNAGAEMTYEQLVRTLTDAFNRSQGVTQWVAQVQAPEMPDRHLGPGRANASVVRSVLSQPEARTAAGGLCAPVQPIYEVIAQSQADRPVSGALPNFRADRGGFSLVPGPELSDLSGSGDIITEAEDTVGATAPCLTFSCEATRTFEVDKITRCLTFGNMVGRTSPEMVDAWVTEAAARHAELAEGRILGEIRAVEPVATRDSSAATGTWSEFFLAASELAAGYRRNPRRRMSPMSPLVMLAPAWLPHAWQGDAARRSVGVDTVPTVAQAEMLLRDKLGIEVTWYQDTPLDEDGALLGPDQRFGAQGGTVAIPAALLTYPTVAQYGIFAPGVWGFADGGTLDFGVVRDSDLNAANNYQLMLETFERAMFLGPANSSVWMQHTLCHSGSIGGRVTVAC